MTEDNFQQSVAFGLPADKVDRPLIVDAGLRWGKPYSFHEFHKFKRSTYHRCRSQAFTFVPDVEWDAEFVGFIRCWQVDEKWSAYLCGYAIESNSSVGVEFDFIDWQNNNPAIGYGSLEATKTAAEIALLSKTKGIVATRVRENPDNAGIVFVPDDDDFYDQDFWENEIKNNPAILYRELPQHRILRAAFWLDLRPTEYNRESSLEAELSQPKIRAVNRNVAMLDAATRKQIAEYQADR